MFSSVRVMSWMLSTSLTSEIRPPLRGDLALRHRCLPAPFSPRQLLRRVQEQLHGQVVEAERETPSPKRARWRRCYCVPSCYVKASIHCVKFCKYSDLNHAIVTHLPGIGSPNGSVTILAKLERSTSTPSFSVSLSTSCAQIQELETDDGVIVTW